MTNKASDTPTISGEKGEMYSLIMSQSEFPSKSSDEMHFHPTLRNIQWRREYTGLKKLILTKQNLLMPIIPLCFLSYYLNWNEAVVFSFNFLGLIPLAALLGQSTEELALHTGNIIGGLINATFGNIVEMILAYQALEKGLLDVVRGTLLGSLISNLLLVLGMAFLLGGLNHHVQRFNAQGATCGTSLLLLSSFGLLIPTIAAQYMSDVQGKILLISRLGAIAIGITYFFYLVFQLYTHYTLFQDSHDNETSDSVELPECTFLPPLLLLIISTILVAFLSEYLTDTIEPIISNYGISQDFIGIILLPIVGNAAEHMTAVTVAIKNKMDLTIGIAVGSSVQVALLVVPFSVLCGWVLDQPMTLAFSPVSGIILMLTIFVVTGIVSDGESNWLEGLMLTMAYLIVAVVFFIL